MNRSHTRQVMVAATVLTLAAGPLARAEHPASQHHGQDDFMSRITDMLTKENVGKGVGGVLGGVLGSQVGSGSGKTAATIVGALAGYWLGGEVGRRMQASDREGLAHSTATAIETGESQTWVNPDTGVRTEVQVQDADDEPSSRPTQAPPLEMINGWYAATSRSNVRSGPGTNYPVIDQIEDEQEVPVVGRVSGENWYMLARNGRGYGFVHSTLLNPVGQQQADSNAIREHAGQDFDDTMLAQPECTLVTQKVTMPDGSTASEKFRTCRNEDGTWEVA
ncbi:MAG: SH3 domain-containing protein [Gammaproteobacteria bacterium]|nr:SH3 domain-containing protein [Gammaproteobacteria bacterium]